MKCLDIFISIIEKTKYMISSNGRILNMKSGKFIKPHFDGKYYNVRLSIKGIVYSYKIHRLVASAFIPNLNNKKEINHINGDKSDNSISNLEWVSPSENCIKAVLTGLKPKTTTISLTKVHEICSLIKLGCYTNKEIANITNVKIGTVKNIKGKYAWKYISDMYF